jgi:hypothetical protein
VPNKGDYSPLTENARCLLYCAVRLLKRHSGIVWGSGWFADCSAEGYVWGYSTDSPHSALGVRVACRGAWSLGDRRGKIEVDPKRRSLRHDVSDLVLETVEESRAFGWAALADLQGARTPRSPSARGRMAGEGTPC